METGDQQMMENTGYLQQNQQQPFIPYSTGGSFTPAERQNIMHINRPNFLNSIKQKCMDRLTEHRKSAIQRKRQEQMHSLTESKMKSGYIERQVHNEMVQENLMQGFMMQEINNLPQLSIDEFQDEFQNIYNELNEYLAQQLIESLTYDECYHYEKYEQTNLKETEQIAKIYDPQNNDFYICPLCKRYIYKIKGTRISCERPNCIDLDLRIESFNMEELMNMIMKALIEHREGCKQEGRDCCDEEKYIKLKVEQIQDQEEMADNTSALSEALVLFITCQKCSFLEFIALN